MNRGADAGYAKEFIARLSPESRRRLWQWARSLAFRYGLAVDEADDLLQEAIWRLLDRNPWLESEEGFQAYLATAIRSVAFDLLRKKNLEIRHGRTEVPPDAIESVPAKSSDDEARDVRSLLDQLTAREREIAELTLRGFSAREIADRLFIEPATVRSFLRHIRARFAKE